MALPSSMLAMASGLISSSRGRSTFRFVVAGTAIFLLLLLLLPGRASSYLPTLQAPASSVSSKIAIPNQVHFVYILSDPEADFTFQFSRKSPRARLSQYNQPLFALPTGS